MGFIFVKNNNDNTLLDAVVIENKMYAILLGEFQLVVGDLEDSRIRFKRLTKNHCHVQVHQE